MGQHVPISSLKPETQPVGGEEDDVERGDHHDAASQGCEHKRVAALDRGMGAGAALDFFLLSSNAATPMANTTAATTTSNRKMSVKMSRNPMSPPDRSRRCCR